MDIGVGILLFSIFSLWYLLDGNGQPMLHGRMSGFHDGSYPYPEGFSIFGWVTVRQEAYLVSSLVYQRELFSCPVGPKVGYGVPHTSQLETHTVGCALYEV